MERVRLPPQAPHFLKKFFMRSGDKTFPDLRAFLRESIRHEIAAQLSVFDTIGSLE